MDDDHIITISGAFDSGSLDWATIDGSTVTLRPRTYPFNNQTTAWWNHFRIDGAAGYTLTFVFETTGLYLHGHLSASRYVVSYDRQNWQLVDSTSGSGSSYTFTHTFTSNSAWLAYGIPYPVARIAASVERWKKNEFVTATPSANSDLMLTNTATGEVWLTPGGANETGFAIPSHPLYAFQITDPRVASGLKSNVVIMAGNHAGEPVGNHVMEGLVDWLLGDSPRAMALRRAANLLIYPMADPDGRYGGYSRSNQLLPDGNHNYEWDVASTGTLPEVDRMKEAMRRDCNTNAVFFLDLHNQELPNDHYMYVNDGWQNTPFVLGMQNYFSPFRLEISTTWDTCVAKSWAKASSGGLNAANSFTMEPGSSPLATADVYHEYGRAIGWSLFDALVVNTNYYR